MSLLFRVLVFSGLVVTVLSACSSSTSSTTTYDNKGDDSAGGGWFCEMSENEEDWNCVRDETLARNPQPVRLPEPPPSSAAALESDDSIAAFEPAPSNARAAVPVPANQSSNAQDTATQSAQQSSAPPPSNMTAQQELPKHVRLSYRPRTPVSLMDLPEDFWVVQLVSVSSRETLEKYAIDHNLRGMSAARVWSQNQFFYVLILGIYETYENASESSKDLPPPFDKFPPWIRSVGSLQKAMLEADQQAEQAAG